MPFCNLCGNLDDSRPYFLPQWSGYKHGEEGMSERYNTTALVTSSRRDNHRKITVVDKTTGQVLGWCFAHQLAGGSVVRVRPAGQYRGPATLVARSAVTTVGDIK